MNRCSREGVVLPVALVSAYDPLWVRADVALYFELLREAGERVGHRPRFVAGEVLAMLRARVALPGSEEP